MHATFPRAPELHCHPREKSEKGIIRRRFSCANLGDLDGADAMMGNADRILESFIGEQRYASLLFFIIVPLILALHRVSVSDRVFLTLRSAQESFLSNLPVVPKICSIQEQSLKGIRLRLPASLRHSMNMETFPPLESAASEMIFRLESTLVMESSPASADFRFW